MHKKKLSCLVEVSDITLIPSLSQLLIIQQEYPLTGAKKCHKKMKFLSHETKLSSAILNSKYENVSELSVLA